MTTKENDEFDTEVRFLDEAATEAAELVSPNSPEYEPLVERIVERKWEAHYQSND